MHTRRASYVSTPPLNCGVMRPLKDIGDPRAMSLSVTAARGWYLLGAGVFALLAVAITGERTQLANPRFLFDVLLPTLVVSFAASVVLITSTRVASLISWLVAGVLVPIASLAGYLVPSRLAGPLGFNDLAWFELAIGSIFTVPVGLIGHLVLRWFIKRRFSSPTSTSSAVVA